MSEDGMASFQSFVRQMGQAKAPSNLTKDFQYFLASAQLNSPEQVTQLRNAFAKYNTNSNIKTNSEVYKNLTNSINNLVQRSQKSISQKSASIDGQPAGKKPDLAALDALVGGEGEGDSTAINQLASLGTDVGTLFSKKRLGKQQFPFLTKRQPLSNYPSQQKNQLDNYINQIKQYQVAQNNDKINWPIKNMIQGAKYKKKQAYMTTLADTLKQKEGPLKEIAQQYPTFLQWKDDKYVTSKQGTLAKYLQQNKVQKMQRALDQSRALAQLGLSQDQLQNTIPPLLTKVISSNNAYSKMGIGPKSRNSLPLYAGRWVDPITGRMRILPKASTKYVNPLSYQQKKQYLEARLINKWNQYIDSEYSLLKFNDVTADTYQRKQSERLKKKITSQINSQKVYNYFYNQLSAYIVGAPVPQTTLIVCGLLSKKTVQNFFGNSNKSMAVKDLITQLQQILKTSQTEGAPKDNDKLNAAQNAQQLQAYRKKINALIAWIQKPNITSGRGLIQLLKMAIPNGLTGDQAQQIKKKMDDAKDIWNARVKITQKQFQQYKTSVDNPSMKTFTEMFQNAKKIAKNTANPLLLKERNRQALPQSNPFQKYQIRNFK